MMPRLSKVKLTFWTTLAMQCQTAFSVRPPPDARAAGDLQALGPSSALQQCGGPTQLQWSGSVGQTEVAVIDADNRLVRSFDRQPANTASVTWYPINATSGSQLYLLVRDETGQTSRSAVMLVGNGGNADICSPVMDPALPSFTLFSGASILPSQTASTSDGVSLSTSSTSSADAMMRTTAASPLPTTSRSVTSESLATPSSLPTSALKTSTSAPAVQTNGSQRRLLSHNRRLDGVAALSTVVLLATAALWYAA